MPNSKPKSPSLAATFLLLLFAAGSATAFVVGVESPVDPNQRNPFKIGTKQAVPGSGQSTLGDASLNLQSFPGALGGAKAPGIVRSTATDRPYQVANDTFPDFETASMRTCDLQMNSCSRIANKQQSQQNGKTKKNRASFTVSDCDNQKSQCATAQKSAPFRTFNLVSLGSDPNDPNFELLCAP